MKNRVVPLRPRHKHKPGDEKMEFMYGNTLIIFNEPEVSPEESAQAERDMHMALWAIVEEAWEKGEAV